MIANYASTTSSVRPIVSDENNIQASSLLVVMPGLGTRDHVTPCQSFDAFAWMMVFTLAVGWNNSGVV